MADQASVTCGTRTVIAKEWHLNLPSRADAKINGSRLLSIEDKGGRENVNIPIVAGTAQTAATTNDNISLNTNQGTWTIPTGSSVPEGVSVTSGGKLRITKPGIYDLIVRVVFSQTTAATLLTYGNGTLLDWQTVSISNAVGGGTSFFTTKFFTSVVYGKTDTGNLDVTFALQATNISGGAAASYGATSVLSIMKNAHTVLV